jgi:dipeptidyl-peptidase-4
VRTVLVDEDEAYLDPIHNFRVLADGKRFLWSSERTGWRHLYLYDLTGRELGQLTSGEWETAEVVGVDEVQGWIYVVGYTQLGLDRHLFRVRLDGTGLTRLTEESGTHQISLDPGARFFTDDASSLGTARTVQLRRADGTVVRTLASTDTRRVAELGLRPPELLTVKAADGVTDLHGLLFEPADFDSLARYPVIVHVYGGPHSRAIRNSYETVGFRAALAQLGFLVAEFDARGTPRRGKRFQAGNYLTLGQADVDDQAAAVRQLGRRPYVDSSRVGVTGISHGGYLTMMLMLRYPDLFSVGVAGAPITDVRNGPRQYIGRFMRTPDANPDGYAKADVNALAGNLRGRLLVHHGTNDRNAVLGNTYQFVKRLVDLGKPVDMMIYPDGVHVLEGRDGVHVMKVTASYFLEHLKPRDWERSRAALW